MRKIISLLLTLCLAICIVPTSAFADDPEDNSVAPYSLYTSSITTKATSAGTNSINYSCQVIGKSGTTQVKIYLYLEEYKNGAWTGVDCVTKFVNATSATASDTYTSAVRGRKYRAYASIYAYKGTAYEHIDSYSSIITK